MRVKLPPIFGRESGIGNQGLGTRDALGVEPRCQVLAKLAVRRRGLRRRIRSNGEAQNPPKDATSPTAATTAAAR